MNPLVKSGLGFGLAWCLIKYVAYLIEPMPENIIPMVLINILFLLLAIAVGLFIQKRNEKEESNALNDIKNGLKAGLPYTVIVCVFIYFLCLSE